MGRTERGTPKDLANRMKAKGLQKLRWYCQMCQKQCRDENGFKCHTSSESHQRQLLLFADDPNKYIDSFSQEFLEGFTNLMKRRFGTKRVSANNVYQEYIHDRDHVHMNSTQWETLTDFVKWMGREGHAIVDETDKGWYVQYIDRGPEAIRMQEQEAKRKKSEKRRRDAEEEFNDFIKKQADLNKDNTEVPSGTNLNRNGEEPISLKMTFNAFKKPKVPAAKLSNPLSVMATSSKIVVQKDEKKRSSLSEIMDSARGGKLAPAKQQPRENLVSEEEPWLAKDIFVKIVTADRSDPSFEYYKQKGIVVQVIDGYGGVVQLSESGAKLQIDQHNLQTVIPGRGKMVKVVLGPNKAQLGILCSLNSKSFSADIEISLPCGSSKMLNSVPYENFSKYNENIL